MAQVEVIESLYKEIRRKFKRENVKVLQYIKGLENNPKRGKLLGTIGGIVIKELKYKGFRFYFLTDGYKLKCLNKEKLTDLLLRFVRMSDKKHQQETIEEIKKILRTMGPEGF